MFTISKKTN